MLFSPSPEYLPNINEDTPVRQALSRTGIPACPCLNNLYFGKKGQTGMSVLLDNAGKFFQVSDEAAMFEAARFVIRSSQN